MKLFSKQSPYVLQLEMITLIFNYVITFLDTFGAIGKMAKSEVWLTA